MSHRLRGIVWGRNRRAQFAPAQMGSVLLWLDAADDRSITITGSGVSSWANKAGGGSAATQITDGSRPTRVAAVLNGLPALRFATQNLTGTMAQTGAAFSAFIVCNMQSGASSGGRAFAAAFTGAGDASTNGWSLGRDGSTQAQRLVYNAAARTSAAITYNTPFLHGNVVDAAGASSRINGGTAVTSVIAPTINITLYCVGAQLASGVPAAAVWSSDIFEILVFTATLADAQRHQAEGYLGHKWFNGSILPSDHPYKSSAP